MTDSSFCAARARQAAQPLAGTAVRATQYVFLPVRKSLWGSVDLDFSWAPESVAVFIKAQRRNGTVTRFYNPPPGAPSGSVVIFGDEQAARTVELTEPWFQDIDTLERLYAPDSVERAAPALPFIAVCTHGTRDRCCAKWGFAAFQKIRRDLAPDQVIVLESSHLGGDRMAATAVSFPGGHMYGHLSGAIDYSSWRDTKTVFRWENYRGCAFEPPLAQIIRAGLGLRGIGTGKETLEIFAERTESKERDVAFRFGSRDGVARVRVQEFGFYSDCKSIAQDKPSNKGRLVLDDLSLRD